MAVQTWARKGKHCDCVGMLGGYCWGSVVCGCGCVLVGVGLRGDEVAELEGDHMRDCMFGVYRAGEEVVLTGGFEVSGEGWDDFVLGR